MSCCRYPCCRDSLFAPLARHPLPAGGECPAWLSGYSISGAVAGPNGLDDEQDSCLYAFTSKECAPESSPAPVPSPPPSRVRTHDCVQSTRDIPYRIRCAGGAFPLRAPSAYRAQGPCISIP